MDKNEIKRELMRANERIKTLELDLEPDGRISESIEALSQEIDSLRSEMKAFRTESSLFRQETRKNFDRVFHSLNRVLARQEVLLESFSEYSHH